MPRYNQTPQDATVVMLPQYREAAVRPYRPGDYTKPSSRSELRQLDRPPSLGFQLMTAGENYNRAHDFFKDQFDKTGLTDAAADARDYYDDELYLTHPGLAAVGSTLAGEAFDFWREAATDPINIATAGMGAAPRAALGSGVRSGTLHRAVKLAKAVDDAQMGRQLESQERVTEEYVKRLRDLRHRQRELAAEKGVQLSGFEASEPLHMTAMASALEDGLGRTYDTRSLLAFPGDNEGFKAAFGYDRVGSSAVEPYVTGGGDGHHTLIDATGRVYGGNPAKVGAGMRDIGLETRQPGDPGVNLYNSASYASPYNRDNVGKMAEDKLARMWERHEKTPAEYDWWDHNTSWGGAWRSLQDLLSSEVVANDANYVGGVAGARKWDAGVPIAVVPPEPIIPPYVTDKRYIEQLRKQHSDASYAARKRAVDNDFAYRYPRLLKYNPSAKPAVNSSSRGMEDARRLADLEEEEKAAKRLGVPMDQLIRPYVPKK